MNPRKYPSCWITLCSLINVLSGQGIISTTPAANAVKRLAYLALLGIVCATPVLAIPPTISSTYPGSNGFDAPVDTVIIVTFSNSMDITTINSNTFVVFSSQTGRLQGNYTFNADTTVISFTPTHPFTVGEPVGVTLTTGIADANGDTLVKAHVWEFFAQTHGGSSAFNLFGSFSTASSPYRVAAADFDEDGNADVVVTNQYSASVSVFMGHGDGTFSEKVDYVTATKPQGITAADVNGDGYVDLIVANNMSGSMSILLNNGDGTFAGHVQYNAWSGPESVAAADLDGDGDIDLAFGNPGLAPAAITYAMGDGNGAFPSQSHFNAVADNASTITISDNDGDGDFDLSAGHVTTFSSINGAGNGTFGSGFTYQYTTGTIPYALVAADFDSNGTADIIVANKGSNTISYFSGDGDRTFATKVDFSTHAGPQALISGDFDGNGTLDLAVADSDTTYVSVLLGDNSGSFAAKSDYAAAQYPTDIASVDLDNDGDLDLVVVNNSSNMISVLINRDLAQDIVLPANDLAFGDVPKDTPDTLDFIVVNYGVNNTLLGGVHSLGHDQLLRQPDYHQRRSQKRYIHCLSIGGFTGTHGGRLA
jgi:hypothetical protein